MSSSDVRSARLPIADRLVVGFISVFLLGLAGCVQPLYAPAVGGDQSIVERMRAIKVEPIPDRLGHYLQNELIFALNGTGSAPTPKYRLVVTFHERMGTPAINTVTGQAEAGDLSVDADYTLTPIAGGGSPIANGSVHQFVAYDRTSQRLSNVRAARDAEIRNAKSIADQIRTRIAIAMASSQP
jgi:LPS-assembly lipoprotein